VAHWMAARPTQRDDEFSDHAAQLSFSGESRKE
jgi:hypothetical protein